MLHLASQTASAWAHEALEHLEEILLDHAHCEKKAASTAVGLLFRYPEKSALLAPLSRLAREELVHFEQVLGELEQRQIPFQRQLPSPYAGRLFEAVRKSEPERLLDTLLCCALIEARSCERFTLLADSLADESEGNGDRSLALFYRGLLESEARHHGSYCRMAEAFASKEGVAARLAELAEHEAAVIQQGPPMARLHAVISN